MYLAIFPIEYSSICSVYVIITWLFYFRKTFLSPLVRIPIPLVGIRHLHLPHPDAKVD